jgi:hypothetical protein
MMITALRAGRTFHPEESSVVVSPITDIIDAADYSRQAMNELVGTCC